MMNKLTYIALVYGVSGLKLHMQPEEPAAVPDESLVDMDLDLPEPTYAELNEAGEKEFVELGSEAEA